MPAFQTLLAGLRRAESQLERQLAGVRDALSALQGRVTRAGRGRPAKPGRKPRRRISAAGRAKLRAAAKRRWAEAKKAGRTRLG